MKIFVSWSGALGKQLADGLRKFLPSALPGAEPFFSSQDIRAGEIGLNKILTELKTANFGLILLTPESYTAPWVLFEAGYLQGSVFSTVMPVLCALDISRLQHSPLGQLQCTPFSREGLRSIVLAVNEKSVLARHKSEELAHWFDSAWERHEMGKLEELVAAHQRRLAAATTVADQVAAGIVGQGDLATMNLEDLKKLFATRDKQKS